MLKITGTKEEIKRIKSSLWCSSDCPICNNPSEQCLKGLSECNDIDKFYECIEENVCFETVIK